MNRTLEETKGLIKNIKNGMSGRAELDWVNDIKLFIDSQEQTIKELREANQYQKDTMKVYYDKLQTLREEIESLKCCGNCKVDYHVMQLKCKNCDRSNFDVKKEDIDLWIKR